MAIEARNARKGYLYRSLADGAKPFLYRNRIRTLLGLPQPGGVEMNFSRPLPIAGFTYIVPRFRGEFEFPDELFAGGTRSGIHSENMAHLDSHAAVSAAAKDEAQRGRQLEREAGEESEFMNRLTAEKTDKDLPEFPAAPAGANRLKARDSSQSLSKTDTQPDKGRREPVDKAYDEFVPGDSRHSSPASSAIKVSPSDQLPQSTSLVPSLVETADSSTRDLTGVERSKKERILPSADKVMARPRPSGTAELSKSPAPEHLTAALKPLTAVASSSKQKQRGFNSSHEPAGADHLEFREDRLPGLDQARPLVAQSRIFHRDEANETLVSGSSPARRPEGHSSTRGQRSSETAQETSPSSDSRKTALAAAQPQVVVVKQAFDSGTPIAFWERRYLNHLRVRVRR